MATQLLSAEIQKPTSPTSDFKSSTIHLLNMELIMELIDFFKMARISQGETAKKHTNALEFNKQPQLALGIPYNSEPTDKEVKV